MLVRMSYTFQLTDFEEEHAPPSLPVLDVTVVGTTIFLAICEYDESNTERTLNVIADISVDGEAFMKGCETSVLEFDRSLKRAQKRNAEYAEAEKRDVERLKGRRGGHRFQQSYTDPNEPDCALCGVMREFHGNAGFSEETCTRCGWRMGSPPLNCNNDNTPHVFPSQIDKAERAVQDIPLHECGSECADDPI
jgi:hypothetical protein